MGFPETMYLSKSQVRRLWPELPLSQPSRARFQEVVASSSAPVPGSGPMSWPPWEASEIVSAIDAYVDKHEPPGTWTELSRGTADGYYRLGGRLIFNQAQGQFPWQIRELKAHTVDALYCGHLAGEELAISVALENVAGIDRRGENWEVRESGAMYMFRDMAEEGFAARGLFEVETRPNQQGHYARVVYLQRGDHRGHRR
jgi:hypothetical protein